MIAEVFQFVFEGETESLVKGEKEAEKQNEKLQKGLKKTDQMANDLGSGFSDFIATAGGALVSILSLSALTQGIAETSEYVDNLGKTARMYGENATQLAAYQEQVVKAGGDIGSFQGVIKKLNGDFNEFVTTGTTGILPFMQRLGIDMVDAQGKARKVTDIFPELARQFETMSKAESAGIGEKLGLDEGTITLLQQGEEGLNKLIEKQKSLFSITDEQVKVFEDFNDSVSDTKTAFRGMFVQLGSDILPILQYFMEKLQGGISFLTTHKELVTGMFIALGTSITAYALPAIIKFGIATVTAFAPFYLIGGIIAGIAVAVGLLYEDIMIFLEGGNSGFEKLLKWLSFTDKEVQQVRETFSKLGEVISDVFNFAIDLLGGFFNLIGTIGKGIFKAFEPLLWVLGKGIVLAVEGAIKAVSGLVDIAKGIGKFFGFGGDEEKTINLNENKNITTSNLNSGSLEAETNALKAMASSPLNNMTPNMITNQGSTRSTNNSVKVDKIEVVTQATDADGIALAVDNSLAKQMKKTTATFEDGIQG